MFWGNKCPHKFLPRDFGAENGFYWQMASSNIRHHMFLVGLAYPDLAKIKKECAEHTMASVVELSLGSTFSHSWIQLGFISLGHFGWFFFSERNHIKVTLGRSFPRMWCGYDLPSAPMVRMERGGGGGGEEQWRVHLYPQISEAPDQERTGAPEKHGMSLKWRQPQGNPRKSILHSLTPPLGKPYTFLLSHEAHTASCLKSSMCSPLPDHSSHQNCL